MKYEEFVREVARLNGPRRDEEIIDFLFLSMNNLELCRRIAADCQTSGNPWTDPAAIRARHCEAMIAIAGSYVELAFRHKAAK